MFLFSGALKLPQQCVLSVLPSSICCSSHRGRFQRRRREASLSVLFPLSFPRDFSSEHLPT